MFEAAAAENALLSAALRVVGAGMAVAGWRLMLGRLLGFLGYVPVVGGVFRLGLTAIAGVLGTSMAVSVLAASWLVHRPLLAVLALAAAIALGWLVIAPTVRSQRKVADGLPPTVNAAEATAPGR